MTQQAEDRYTYPLVLLSEFPSMPDHVELTQLRLAFSTTYSSQLLLGSLSVPPASRNSIAPHLLFAMACMAAVAEDEPDRPRKLFFAAITLWSVMMEIDNRETRTDEALVAVSPLSSYGLYADRRRACFCLSTVLLIQTQRSGVGQE